MDFQEFGQQTAKNPEESERISDDNLQKWTKNPQI